MSDSLKKNEIFIRVLAITIPIAFVVGAVISAIVTANVTVNLTRMGLVQ